MAERVTDYKRVDLMDIGPLHLWGKNKVMGTRVRTMEGDKEVDGKNYWPVFVVPAILGIPIPRLLFNKRVEKAVKKANLKAGLW